jgi:hypothetical protein
MARLSHFPVRATRASSGPRFARPPRRGTHGTPVSSSSAPGRSSPCCWRSWSPCRCSSICSSAANSVSSASHTSGPFGCSTAVLASLSGVESVRQPPRFAWDPGGEIWPPREHIGAGSTAGNRSAIARARSRSSRQGSDAANRTYTWRPRSTWPHQRHNGRRGARAAGRARRPGRRRRRGPGQGRAPAAARCPGSRRTPAPCTASLEARQAAGGRASPG